MGGRRTSAFLKRSLIVLLLVGGFALGAAIVVAGQYRYGLLAWVLGAQLVAWLANSQAALIVALVLTLTWSAAETFGLGRNPYAWFFLPWTAALVLIYRQQWLPALRVAGTALLAWCLMVTISKDFLERPWLGGERMALCQIYLFAGIALYIVGRGMGWSVHWPRLAPPVVMVGATLAVAALFALSFPALHAFGVSAEFAPLLSTTWLVVTGAMLFLVGALMVWRYLDTELATLPLYRQGAFGWLMLAAALAVANLLSAGEFGGWAALGYNLLAVAGVVWLVLTGVDRAEPRIVNLGIVLLAALLLARYVDTFWTLLARSYFFFFGGVLLLVAGFLLQRWRRRLHGRIDKSAR
jgi:uncharacterized membrane protein